MDSDYLIIEKIIECGSFLKASQELHMTPSSISHAVAKIERNIGFKIFTRSKAGVSLTKNGMRLLPYIHSINYDYVRIDREINRIRNTVSGTLRIEAPYSTTVEWLSPVLGRYKSLYPDVETFVYQILYSNGLNLMESAFLDCALGPRLTNDNIQFFPLCYDPMVCVSSPDYVPANGKSVTIDDLANYPVLMQEDCIEIEEDNLIRRMGISIDRHFHLTDDQAVVSMASTGIGLAIMPSMTCKYNICDVSIWPLVPQECRLIGINISHPEIINPATAAFKNVLEEYVRETIPYFPDNNELAITPFRTQ